MRCQPLTATLQPSHEKCYQSWFCQNPVRMLLEITVLLEDTTFWWTFSHCSHPQQSVNEECILLTPGNVSVKNEQNGLFIYTSALAIWHCFARNVMFLLIALQPSAPETYYSVASPTALHSPQRRFCKLIHPKVGIRLTFAEGK